MISGKTEAYRQNNETTEWDEWGEKRDCGPKETN